MPAGGGGLQNEYGGAELFGTITNPRCLVVKRVIEDPGGQKSFGAEPCRNWGRADWMTTGLCVAFWLKNR